MDQYSEKLSLHIRTTALAHGWVTPDQDTTYLWEIAVVLWLKQHRPGILTTKALPDAGTIQTALAECDTVVLYGARRSPIGKFTEGLTNFALKGETFH